jgi:hypothetical protein
MSGISAQEKRWKSAAGHFLFSEPFEKAEG